MAAAAEVAGVLLNLPGEADDGGLGLDAAGEAVRAGPGLGRLPPLSLRLGVRAALGGVVAVIDGGTHVGPVEAIIADRHHHRLRWEVGVVGRRGLRHRELGLAGVPRVASATDNGFNVNLWHQHGTRKNEE